MNCPCCKKRLFANLSYYPEQLSCDCQSLNGRSRITTLYANKECFHVILWLTNNPQSGERLKILQAEGSWFVLSVAENEDTTIISTFEGKTTLQEAWENLQRYQKLLLFS